MPRCLDDPKAPVAKKVHGLVKWTKSYPRSIKLLPLLLGLGLPTFDVASDGLGPGLDALARGLGKGGERKEEKKGGIGGQPGTQFERTFIAVKPDGVQRGLVGEIIGRFEKRGFKLVALKMTTPTKEKAEGHYADLAGRPFFPALVKFFSSGPIVGMVWEGRNAIQIGRQMLGATKPIESAPGSIRGDFGIDVGRNVCHGSDGPSGAQREIAFWFTPEEVSSWNNTIGVWIHE